MNSQYVKAAVITGLSIVACSLTYTAGRIHGKLAEKEKAKK